MAYLESENLLLLRTMARIWLSIMALDTRVFWTSHIECHSGVKYGRCASQARGVYIEEYQMVIASLTTYDHRSVRTGHPVRNPLFSPSFVVPGSQRVVGCMLRKSDSSDFWRTFLRSGLVRLNNLQIFKAGTRLSSSNQIRSRCQC